MLGVSGTANDDDLAALVQQVTEAAEALISGDIKGYTARINAAGHRHRPDPLPR